MDVEYEDLVTVELEDSVAVVDDGERNDSFGHNI
jgi:hypothetical protein